ncbi:PREDICTED: unconventional myosin-Va-like [Nicotiana attenuata]|uniref:unconventional myosin-Va-like n=1 Tax=Nicotiana attenuata TaxID=49451 RepID=UPI000905ADA5|nr:PREDICTED: unconventional myosin-Va-like [Nicotiana attenuata]
MKYRKAFLRQRYATLEIQRFARGAITRKSLLGASCYSNISKLGDQTLALKILLQAVLKLQRWWRGKLLHEQRTKAALVIQSHVRGWTARRSASRNKHQIIVIQIIWKLDLVHGEKLNNNA